MHIVARRRCQEDRRAGEIRRLAPARSGEAFEDLPVARFIALQCAGVVGARFHQPGLRKDEPHQQRLLLAGRSQRRGHLLLRVEHIEIDPMWTGDGAAGCAVLRPGLRRESMNCRKGSWHSARLHTSAGQ